MSRPVRNMCCHVAVTITTILLPACSMGPSESEFVAACLEQGTSGANQAMAREMGIVDREATCKCMAKEAKATVSADVYRVMILDMQGKKQEAAAITSKMGGAEQLDALGATMQVFGTCVMGAK